MRYMNTMASRTTLMLDDDVRSAARALADRDHRTMGEIVSELVRNGLRAGEVPPNKTRNGITLISRSPGSRPVITPELVKALFEENE